MTSPLPSSLSRRRSWAAVILALGLVAADLRWCTSELALSWVRLLAGAAACLALLPVVGSGAAGIGLRLNPAPDLRFWARCLGWLALASLLLLLVLGSWLLLTTGLPASTYRPDDLWFHFSHSVLQAPLSEELIYRCLLCGGALPLLGFTPTLLLSAGAFAYLHVCYGNFAPNHVLAGLIMGYAYLRSGCLWLPIALHALGNLLIFGLQVGLLRLGSGA